MAAFLEGKLAPGEIAEVAAHLRDCAECRTVAGEAARFEAEEEEARAAAAGAAVRPRAFARWKVWAAAAVAAIAAATPLLLRPAQPIAALVEATPREYRRVEGRLSGFPWAKLRGGQRGAETPPAENALSSAAYKVLERTAGDEAVQARHAAGVAHLLIDQERASLDELASAAGDSKDARVWNDLAAARYTVAVREDNVRELPDALAAADRAIQLDPNLPEARFNRALILEEQKLYEAAREEWQRYLALDPSGPWSSEAREHLRSLGPVSRLDFRSELARAARDRAATASLVQRFPQESRLEGEGPLLSGWAKAFVANDAARAEENLALARAVGEELHRRGERLLLDSVQAIERAPDRRAAAEACLLLDAARAAYRRRDDLASAERDLQRAAEALRAAGIPLADVAEYFAAQCAFDRNRPAESTARHEALRARLAPAHRALAADVDLGLARNANASARWGEGYSAAARATATFTALGETANLARAAAAEAVSLERMGALDLAWQRRIAAIGGASPSFIATILHSAAVALAAADRTETAIAVIDVAAGYAKEPRLGELRATICIDRARLAERAGDLEAARRWLGEARAEVARLDAKLRDAREAQIDLAEAVLLRATNPAAAIEDLGRSIDFFEAQHNGIRLPDAYLQRARAQRALGRTDAALGDYHAALRAIAEQQKQVSEASLPVEFLDVAAQTIDETIDLHLERGEVDRAFAVADRARAMGGAAYRTAAIPNGTAVLEYALLPRSVAIFCATRDGVAAARVPIERHALSAKVHAFVRKMREQTATPADAQSLHALLIAPVAAKLARAGELVIVPDRELHVLPFAALHDGRAYLVERHALRVAPSAAASAPVSIAGGSGAVVIADPATTLARRLPWSRGEAARIAGLYQAAVLEGAAATRARVAEAMASSSLVHYAGHADSDLGSYGALLLASEENDPGLLSASEIARLDLRARPLVVLSACGTLRGATTHIAGMPSLARAFLGAGARTVVGTLWEIDDDVAAPLFFRFHERLRDGEVPAAALRDAQIEMLQSSDPRLRHPSSWSAVEVLSNL